MTRRGVGLVLALVVITLVGTTISLLTLQVAGMARQRQYERAHTYAQILLNSGIAYVHSHPMPSPTTSPADPVVLATDGLLPAAAQGQITLTRTAPDAPVHVEARVELGGVFVVDEITFPG